MKHLTALTGFVRTVGGPSRPEVLCRIYRFLILLASLAWFGSTVTAQITGVTSTTATPMPGRGHDYIQMLNETVNPANGAVSLRVAVPVPPGRQLTAPFSFAYDSNGVHFTADLGIGGTWRSNIGYLSKGGWSYSVPLVSYGNSQTNFPNENPPYSCSYLTYFMLQDSLGGRHNLHLVTDSFDDYRCPPQFPGIATGGDADFQSTASQHWSVVTASDLDGTTYTFQGPWQAVPGAGGGFSLPALVEDRNGNKISITDLGNGVFTQTDTLGRAAISSSGFGVDGNTLTVGGQPYTVSWGTATSNFTLGFTSVDPTTPCVNGTDGFPAHDSETQPVIRAITLPNGKQYQFSYDPTYGLLSQVTFPTGGWVKYTWGSNPLSEFNRYGTYGGGSVRCLNDWFAVIHRYVSFDGTNVALQQDFSYGTTWSGVDPSLWTTKRTTVTSRDLLRGTSFVTNYVYTPQAVRDNNPYSPGDISQIPAEQTITYQDGSGHTLRTVSKSWYNDGLNADAILLLDKQDTLENGQTSKTAYVYAGNNTLALLIEKDEYDYGPTGSGPLLRKTITNYASFAATPTYPYAPSLLDRPSNVITYDGSNTRVAETDYAYDQQTSVAVSPSPTGHDETNYAASYNNRGNATAVTLKCLQSCTDAVTKYTYDETGQVLTMVDACGNATCSDMSGSNHTTTYSYADSYTTLSGGQNVSYTPSGNTNALLTKITDPLGHAQNFTYDFNNGQLTIFKDQNSQSTTYLYNDSMARPTQVSYPNGGQTTFAYNDAVYNPATPSPSVTTTKAITSTTNLTTLAAFDGLGHTVRSSLTSDPDCATGDRTDTTYDGLGRVYTVSNLYCTTSDLTYGLATYTYDALGRITQLAHPDNSTVLTTYTGRATQVQDEGNGGSRVTRISQTDGLGRLKSVCEVSSASLIGSGGTAAACGQDIAATGFLTSYLYDALDNLTSVSMSGLNPRTFAYDSFSRLTSATNPESGQICYGTVSAGVCQSNGYDANSNLVTKTDARSIAATFSYDALNRLTGKTYSDGTPAATFNYDQTSALGVTLTNTVGRKSSESTAGSNATGSVFSYDTMGRISNNSQCTPQNCGIGMFAFQYTQYDFLGDLTSATNAAGVTFTYAYNTAGRLTGITTNFIDPSHPGTLLSNAHYNPFGFLTGATLGNGVTESWSYNNRGWQKTRTVTFGATTPYSFNLATFAPDGDVLAANDSANGNWVYAYDAFNRLTCSNLASNGTCATPTSGTPTYTYDYDRFGNRWHQNGPRLSQLGFDANNRITGVTGVGYDAAGDLTSDGSGAGSHTYFYDAENRIIQVDGTLGNCSTATACYVYNADGQRARKTTGGSSMDYLYDLSGHKVADVAPAGVFMRGELYAGNRHFAIYAPAPGPTGATFFTHSDWLGTERVRTDMTGTNCESIASLPFGDGQSITGTCGDVSPLHFTGKERDSESGLDNFGARYDSSSLGRWMSPDAINLTDERVQNPANTLNKYVYGGNNPLKYVDPDGRDITVFYSNGGRQGHFWLFAYDQSTGNSAILDFGPKAGSSLTEEAAGIGVPGDTNYGSHMTSADEIRQDYTSLTIQTNPEDTQKAIEAINTYNGVDHEYMLYQQNCTTVCRDVFHKILKLDSTSIRPVSLWGDIYRKWSNAALSQRQGSKPPNVQSKHGTDYGRARYGMNTFDFAWLLLHPPPKEVVTVRILCGPADHPTPCQ